MTLEMLATRKRSLGSAGSVPGAGTVVEVVDEVVDVELDEVLDDDEVVVVRRAATELVGPGPAGGSVVGATVVVVVDVVLVEVDVVVDVVLVVDVDVVVAGVARSFGPVVVVGGGSRGTRTP